MHPVAVAVAISAGGGVARVPVPRLPDPSSKRRRLSVKGPAPSLYPPLPQPPVADPVIRLRRLRIKGPAPFLLPRPPQSPAAVLPLSTSLWKDQNEVTFEFLPHRRKYRWIYNKFQYWFFVVVQSGPGSMIPAAQRSCGSWDSRISAVSVSSRRISLCGISCIAPALPDGS